VRYTRLLPDRCHHVRVEITPEAIIEDILDPLMTGALAEECPAVTFHRISGNEVLLDFGVPDRVFVLAVVERPRS
jgi:hypothetical protein